MIKIQAEQIPTADYLICLIHNFFYLLNVEEALDKEEAAKILQERFLLKKEEALEIIESLEEK